MSTNTPDSKNKRWTQEEEDKLKSLVSLLPVLNDPRAPYKRKRDAWEGIAIMMESRTVEQCKTKLYNLKRYDNQEGGSSSVTNLPSSTVGSTNVDNKNIRWSKDEENKLKILILLNPIVKDPKASTKSKQDAWDLIAKKMQSSRTVEQCKSKFHMLNKECSNQGGPSSETNPPSSTVGLPSPSTSKGVNTSQISSSTLETTSRTESTKQRSSDIQTTKGNKIKENNEIEDPMQHFFQSILSDIKKLSQDKQMVFKQKVMETIVELSKDE